MITEVSTQVNEFGIELAKAKNIESAKHKAFKAWAIKEIEKL